MSAKRGHRVARRESRAAGRLGSPRMRQPKAGKPLPGGQVEYVGGVGGSGEPVAPQDHRMIKVDHCLGRVRLTVPNIGDRQESSDDRRKGPTRLGSGRRSWQFRSGRSSPGAWPGRVVVPPERLQQLVVADLRRAVDGLGMRGRAGARLEVGRLGGEAAGEADRGRIGARQLPGDLLQPVGRCSKYVPLVGPSHAGGSSIQRDRYASARCSIAVTVTTRLSSSIS
jgi:hypothetical protein